MNFNLILEKLGKQLNYEQAKNKKKRLMPFKKTPNKCNGLIDEDGKCSKCGRYLDVNKKHNPNEIGSLGNKYEWRDGDFYISDGLQNNL